MMSRLDTSNSATLSSNPSSTQTQATGWLGKYLIKKLSSVHLSAINLELADGSSARIGTHHPEVVIPTLKIKRNRAITRSALNGLLGWGEGYMHGDWTCDDLVKLTDWAVFNNDSLRTAFAGTGLIKQIQRLVHRLNDNSKRGSRRNIAFHYDLGNDFYQAWLDPSMSYSSALFTQPNQSLEDAQWEKYHRILAMSEAAEGEHLLEIGCGWGGFAETIAKREGIKLDGVTLSNQQLSWAQARVAKLGAETKIQLNYCDYRDINAQYDRVISIEMFEAVGEAHWHTFFNQLNAVLKTGGTAVLQIICIEPKRFDYYRNHTDFIQRYIFPGGMLPTPQHIRDLSLEHHLQVEEELGFGQDYAHTLALWRHQFLAQWPALEALGYDEKFKRTWEYYLAYCESGFRHDALDVRLFKLRKLGSDVDAG